MVLKEPDVLCKFCGDNDLYELQSSTLTHFIDSVNGIGDADSILVCKTCGRSTVK